MLTAKEFLKEREEPSLIEEEEEEEQERVVRW
jgi:hypothetical protein